MAQRNDGIEVSENLCTQRTTSIIVLSTRIGGGFSIYFKHQKVFHILNDSDT